jgi:transcriptional regulator with XRE-family HTH domain
MLGKRIKDIRKEKGLSLSELAHRAGVSKSLISQIERGITNPSVETIQAIAAVLDEPTFTFFLEDHESLTAIVRKNERLTYKVPGSEVERELLTYNLQRALGLFLFRIPPGAKSSPSLGSHPGGEECVFVLRGELTIHLQDRSYTLEAGDTIYYDSRLPHNYANHGDTEVEIIIAATPAYMRPSATMES